MNTARSFRRGLTLGLLAGAAITAVRLVQSRRPAVDTTPEWPPMPDASPVVLAPEPAAAPAPAPEPVTTPKPVATPKPAPKPAAKPKPAPPWVDPLDDGTCPDTHPVKGKLASGIYHVVGGFNYPRTRAERCYLDVTAAEADGLRPSKR